MIHYPRTIPMDDVPRLSAFLRPGVKIVVGALVAVEIAVVAHGYRERKSLAEQRAGAA